MCNSNTTLYVYDLNISRKTRYALLRIGVTTFDMLLKNKEILFSKNYSFTPDMLAEMQSIIDCSDIILDEFNKRQCQINEVAEELEKFSIECLNFPPYIVKALLNRNITTIGELIKLSHWEITQLPGIGEKSGNEIQNTIDRLLKCDFFFYDNLDISAQGASPEYVQEDSKESSTVYDECLQTFKDDLSELENEPIEKVTNSPHILIFLHDCKINTVGELLQMPLSKLIGLAKNNDGKQIIVEITDIITDIIENKASDKHDTRNDISEVHDINQKIMPNDSSDNLIECLSKSTTTEALIPELDVANVSNKTEDKQAPSQQPSIPDNEMCTSSISRLAAKLGVPRDIRTPNSNPGKSSLEHIESSNSEPENDSLEFIDIFFDPYDDDNIKFLKDMQKYAGIIGSQAPFISFKQKPTYDNMNESQKAWYFYWRTEVRNNRYPNTGVYYIFIHMYELLCGYGWTNAANGYNQIRTLWLSYRERFPSIDHYFFDWSFDFAQLHNIKFIVPEEIDSNIITDSTKCNILIEQCSTDRPLKLPFSLIDILCNYSIISSKFYNDENQLLMRTAIPRVISLVDIALLKKYEKGLLALYCPNKPRKQFYHAFVCAACPKEYKKKVTVYAKRYLESQKLRDYISQVARYAENVLREIKGYRLLRNIQLDADMAALIKHFLNRKYSNANIIEENHMQNLEVKLDSKVIDKLREQSDNVREALKVEDNDRETSQYIVEVNSNSAIIANKAVPEVSKSNIMYFKVSQISDDLSNVISTLSDIQKRALWIIVTSDTPRKDLDFLADTVMSMPEVLIDEINDIASEYLDDILIDVFDDSPYILEQYKQELRENAMEVTI